MLNSGYNEAINLKKAGKSMMSAREKAKWALFAWQAPQDLERLARISGVSVDTLELWMTQLEIQAYQLFHDDPVEAQSELAEICPRSLPGLTLFDEEQDQYASIGGPIRSKKAGVAVLFEPGLSKTPASLTYRDSAIDYSGVIYTAETAYLYQTGGFYYLLIESIEVGQGHTDKCFVKQYKALANVSLEDMHWKECSLPYDRPAILDNKDQFTVINI